MQKFPRGRPAPIFLTTAAGTDFDSLRPRSGSWLTDWTVRALQVTQGEARSLLEPVIRLLSDGDRALLVRFTSGAAGIPACRASFCGSALRIGGGRCIRVARLGVAGRGRHGASGR